MKSGGQKSEVGGRKSEVGEHLKPQTLNPEPIMSTIILCAGKKRIPTSVETSISNAMTPINGKPVIGWILDDLIRKQITDVVIVLRDEDEKFKAFLQRAYAQRMNLTLAPVSGNGTILHSLLAGLAVERDSVSLPEQRSRVSPNEPVRIILGDTLIRDSFESEDDFVYVGDVEESKRWCLPVVTDEGVITEYVDKKNLSGGPFKAIAGYYHLHHSKELLNAVKQSLESGKKELSDALLLYGAVHPIKIREVEEWYDFGHIDMIVDARRRLLQPRHFNSLIVNPVLNTITKVSRNDEKLQDELNWYKNLPPELQVLAPRVLSHEQMNGHLHLVQEYYGYPTLAELFVYGDLDAETWFSILRNVLRVHNEFCRYEGSLSKETIRDFYVVKTEERIGELRRTSKEWEERLRRDTVQWNGRELRNLSALLPSVRERAARIAESAPVRIIHGDLCFSNILYDVNNQIIRLIDPRGSFGKQGIYGDARYDLAKLRHSIAGMYDYIIADMFSLEECNGVFRSEIYANGIQAQVAKKFDIQLEHAGYAIDEIKFIEGLLFVSMLPLHADNPRRQLMMYLRGLELLNDVL